MSEKYKDYSEKLFNALQSNDIDTLIKITTSEPLRERLKINEKYLIVYGKNLIDDIKAFLKDDFKNLMLGLYTNKFEYDAKQIYKAIEGKELDEDAIIELFVTRQGWMMPKIKKAYKDLYNIDLEKHIKDKTSGDFQNLLIYLLNSNRNENDKIDKEKCKSICTELNNTIKSNLGIVDQNFYKFICGCSPIELMTVAREFHGEYKQTLEQVVEKIFPENIQEIIKSIFLANLCPSQYFAKRIYDALNKGEKFTNILNRIIVCRNEIDIDIIKKYYNLQYSKEMIEDLKYKIDGDYEKLILALINKN